MSDDEREEVEDQKEEKEEKESASKGPKKKFEVKKWNAVALWAWGNIFDTIRFYCSIFALYYKKSFH